MDSLYVIKNTAEIIYIYGVVTRLADTVGALVCQVWLPRLPVAGAHVTPLEGGSPVGGHGDVFSGGSPWTVTGPLPDLPDLLVFLLFIP